jgi:SpoVK/Ycf46/Vps4 family AAA+-type ATPase
MTASIIARELGMDLFRVEISAIVSKYVGETEKNLAKVFDEAASGHAVLLFDEADALFTKRTEVKSSNDRYSNLEVNYLLQKIESFEGVTVLTTNNADNIDEAFARRIKFKVNFPFPDEQERARLWEFMLPASVERAEAIDFRRLGRAFDLAGGNIKNAVLRAAFQAAEAGAAVDTEFLEHAGIAESREMGKLVRERDGRVVLL